MSIDKPDRACLCPVTSLGMHLPTCPDRGSPDTEVYPFAANHDAIRVSEDEARRGALWPPHAPSCREVVPAEECDCWCHDPRSVPTPEQDEAWRRGYSLLGGEAPPAEPAHPETNGHPPLVPADPLTLANLDRRILNVVDPRQPGPDVRAQCVGLVRAAQRAGAPAPLAETREAAADRDVVYDALAGVYPGSDDDEDRRDWLTDATTAVLAALSAPPPPTEGSDRG